MASLGTRTIVELESQPTCWESAVTLAHTATGLPEPGERVLVLGCGTSFYIAQAYAFLREGLGLGEADAVVASELPQPMRRTYDRAIAISRSGTSVELLMAVKQLPKDLPITALLGDVDTPLGDHKHNVIDLGFADETSVVQTRFATTALSFLRAANGEDLRAEIQAARTAVMDPLPPLPGRQLVVLAHGWSTALAQEAALKCRESAAAWVEAYPAGEYRHGPLAVADERTLVWGLTPLPAVLAAAVGATGARIQQPRHLPQVELIRLQRFAVQWATAKHRDADNPANLGRSVTNV